MRKLFLILILVLGIMNAGMIKDYAKNEIKRIDKVSYCNDAYTGRGELINKCLNE